ncbi:MFS transporter [Bacillus sp. RO1]|uniref:MFS transporter n=1 Tax=Bacillus sp. RO1 TaxID=2722703 RepID=UPI001456E0E9|nr:MFS transporter [Bacillus sp. RO1]NLP52819.1 MFS transporter [Bacillus sp. RO1]
MNSVPSHAIGGSIALKSKQYRRFLYGSFIVRTSDWMDLTVLNWVVFQWTHSALALGIANACRLIPVFLFSLTGGYIADRFDRRHSLLWLYSGIFVLTIMLGIVLSNHATLVMFMVLVFIRSIIMSIEVPVRNAYLSDIVPNEMLGSAITLQTTCIHLARMIGPAMAGVLLSHFSASSIIMLLSLGTIGVLSMIITPNSYKRDKKLKRETKKSTWKETFFYIKRDPVIKSILLISIAPMIFGFPYTTMMPVFAEQLFQAGPEGFGLLLSVSSIGAILSTILLSWKQPTQKGKWLILSSIGFGLAFLLFIVFSKSVLLSFLFMFIVGAISQYYRTLSRMIVQLKVEEAYRGRVLSIALMDRGYIPLGAILIGFIANLIGIIFAGLMMGAGIIVITLILVLINQRLWKE